MKIKKNLGCFAPKHLLKKERREETEGRREGERN